MASSSDSESSFFVGAALLAVLFLIGKCTVAVSSGDEATQQRMPNFTGMQAGKADEILDGWYDGPEPDVYDVEIRDYSAKDRYPEDAWVVVSTWPKAGATVDEDSTVRLFSLRRSEIRWFRQHPQMPRIPIGVPTSQVLGKNGPFAGVRSLVALRYARGQAPAYASASGEPRNTPEDGVGVDPRVEPKRERAPRERLKAADAYETLTVGRLTGPWPGNKLRLGQILTVTVRDKPEEPIPDYSEGDSGSDSFNYDDDDDDDFNVPGRLCPTRFC